MSLETLGQYISAASVVLVGLYAIFKAGRAVESVTGAIHSMERRFDRFVDSFNNYMDKNDKAHEALGKRLDRQDAALARDRKDAS